MDIEFEQEDNKKMILPARRVAKTKRSNAEMDVWDKNRTWGPVIVKGIKFLERRTIKAPTPNSPGDFALIDVDPSYQRGRTNLVGNIVSALRLGGSIPDVPDVAIRPWSDNKYKLWVMDGFQRISALQELGKSFDVNVHESLNLDAEKRFFLAMNNRKTLNANQQVRAWDGPITKLLKTINSHDDNPCWGRIGFDRNNQTKLAASVMVRGIERLLSGKRSLSDIQQKLSRCDKLLVTEEVRSMAVNYCYTMALVFPKSYAREIPALAIAEVARKRWAGSESHAKNYVPPSKTAIRLLSNINWKTRIPGHGSEYLDMAVSIVDRYWK
jgi:hypothetical protein